MSDHFLAHPVSVGASFGRRILALEQARQMVIVGTPEAVAARLTPYAEIGFDTLLLMERVPLDYETLRLFIQG